MNLLIRRIDASSLSTDDELIQRVGTHGNRHDLNSIRLTNTTAGCGLRGVDGLCEHTARRRSDGPEAHRAGRPFVAHRARASESKLAGFVAADRCDER